jgi:hypothetical protein
VSPSKCARGGQRGANVARLPVTVRNRPSCPSAKFLVQLYKSVARRVGRRAESATPTALSWRLKLITGWLNARQTHKKCCASRALHAPTPAGRRVAPTRPTRSGQPTMPVMPWGHSLRRGRRYTRRSVGRLPGSHYIPPPVARQPCLQARHRPRPRARAQPVGQLCTSPPTSSRSPTPRHDSSRLLLHAQLTVPMGARSATPLLRPPTTALQGASGHGSPLLLHPRLSLHQWPGLKQRALRQTKGMRS